MEMQAETLKVDAWKHGIRPGIRSRPFVTTRRSTLMLGESPPTRRAALLRPQSLPLGPVVDYNHPRDLIKAAKDFRTGLWSITRSVGGQPRN
jgi:hypothetical protein